MACAWATLACYGSMMIISYYWGQKVYPIPYQVMRLLGYVLLVVLIGQCFEWLMTGMELSNVMRLVVSTTLIILFMGVVILAEKEELKKIPLLKQWF
jgi:hypothetical protein